MSTTTNPTPGLWSFDESNPTLVLGQDGKIVADCHDPDRPYEECKANARVVMAAGEMLKALKAWKALDEEPFHFDDQRYITLGNIARSLTCTAIAKTGEQS